jgi:hypothetical protein
LNLAFELSGTLLIESSLIKILGEYKRIKESSGGDNSKLVLKEAMEVETHPS